ncbi:MAG: LemA family protein [Bacilli bacterium]|nr:LemA family protein [Bacilli bacterium]
MKVLIVVLIILALLIIFLYNYLVKLNIRCKNAWSQIDNQLKRRSDLIPNLVEVTKGYAKHESKVLVDIVNARNEAKTMSEIAKNSEEITNNVKKLFALSENYPDLKANEVFKNLQIELTGTEDKIAFSRQFYNDSVQQYNTAITIFPNNILAKIMKYKEREYFKVDENDKKIVKVEL